MYALAFILFIVLVFHYHIVTSENCILQPMVTVQHPLCYYETYCWETNIKNEQSVPNFLPQLPTGSPSLSHYQSANSKEFPDEIISNNTKLNSKCSRSYLYRSYDGSCNNLQHPNWGKSNTEMLRFLLPKYRDHYGQEALSVTGKALPLPRIISTTLFKDKYVPSVNHTLAVMQWGQLIAHDTGKSVNIIPNPVDCCAANSNKIPACYPINIPNNDSFYQQYNQTCMSMVRTQYITMEYNCTRYPYQTAAVTHLIDLSELYGSNVDSALPLRKFQSGLLKVYTTDDNRTFPILSKSPMRDCNSDQNITCFHSGDSRINQNTQITCLQTILLREHNRLAVNLQRINSHWDDEQLFQEARKLLIASYQHITYNNWLPLIIGEANMITYDLYAKSNGYSYYDDGINPGTLIGFMSGAYRLFHSSVQGQIYRVNASWCPVMMYNFSDWMNRPGIILETGAFDGFLRGLLAEPEQKSDRYFTKQITEMMFHGSFPYGEDLESFDIQRGRDHGLPSYNDMRMLCNRTKIESFSDLIEDLGTENTELLQQLYADVNDIDFFVGGTLEKPVTGTGSGPTFLCFFVEQFIRKKIGDRFWYEVGNQPHSFTEDQLKEIKKASLSRILCDNGDNITTIQRNGFLLTSTQGNDIVPCSELPSVDLSKWKETL